MPPKKNIKFDKISNNELSVLYVDDAELRHRVDGFNYIIFTINVPDGDLEQVRLMIDDEHLHQIIDYFCNEIKYFPEEAVEDEEEDEEDLDDDE